MIVNRERSLNFKGLLVGVRRLPFSVHTLNEALSIFGDSDEKISKEK
jgi:hypothetical protein